MPFLLLVTLLAPTGADATLADNVGAVVIGVGAIALLIGIARYALDPMFRVIARTRTPELMTAALGVVVFAALIMAAAGLSYAMGAFIAGVMLAESSYRHEIEAGIQPHGLDIVRIVLCPSLPNFISASCRGCRIEQ